MASNLAMSPRSDAGQSQATGTSHERYERYSHVGTHQMSGSYKMNGDQMFSATNGPIEMPVDHHRH